MKKTMYGLLFGFLALFGATTLAPVTPVLAQQDPNMDWGEWGWQNQDLKYNPNVPGHTEEKNDELINIIKRAINRVLGILGLIALGLCLYAGFQMTTAAGDTKKFDDGKVILKNAGIGLAIIALSWMIVSVIFRIINRSIGGGTGI